MNRREFLGRSVRALAGGAVFGGACLKNARTAAEVAGAAPAGGPGRPNILLILADDLGYADLGVQGCRDVPTPNIDSIAENGVRFTNGYVTCPVCSPTRAGLITGRYQQRFGHEFNPGPPAAAGPKFGLTASEKTIAERLKPLGYACGLVGKWHLGYQSGSRPMDRGFDEFFGFLGGAHAYIGDRPNEKETNPIQRGDEPVTEDRYLTDAFGEEAVQFIQRRKDQPFFLFLSFNAVHNPLQATEKYLERFRGIEDGNRRTFAAMLSAMDDAIGAVLAQLREAGLEQNTLIFFLSDNGGPTRATTSRNDPLRGFKGDVFEGGIRVPFLAQWKGRFPAGKTCDHPITALDILPTALAAAGADVAPDGKLDGVDLAPVLIDGNAGPVHDNLFWRFGEQRAIRRGDWKLFVEREDPKPKLYNLREDVGEQTDRAGDMPDKVRELDAAWQAWNQELIPPKWGRAPARGRNAARPPAPEP